MARSRLDGSATFRGHDMNALLITALLLAATSPGTPPVTEDRQVDLRSAVGGSSIAPSVSGFVANDGVPLASAGVYAYRLADLSMRKVVTDAAGTFSFGALPSGIYKIIAHKPGFLPAMVVVTRANAAIFQQIEFALSPEEEIAVEGEDDFWSIRERIPTDVLREMSVAGLSHSQPATAAEELMATRIRAEVQALSGAGQFASAESSTLTGGAASVAAQIGALEVGVEGSFRDLQAKSGRTSASALGSTNGLALNLETGDSDPLNSRLQVSGHRGELGAPSTNPTAAPLEVDYERYGVRWAADVGGGTSQLRADFTEEANFYRDPRLAELGIPIGSSTLNVVGQYQRPLGDRTSVRTGVRHSNRSTEGLSPASRGGELERFELFGVADMKLADDLTIEYGLFTTMNDGEVAFSPQAGVIVGLGSHWRAGASVRQRIHQDENAWRVGFAPLYFGSTERCSSAEEGCYRVHLTRTSANGDQIEVAATLREFADVARLYFSDDFFDQFESLLFVPGDRMPEVRLSIDQRLSPSIKTRFESTVASGGGGVLLGPVPRENAVDYLVTSLDTRFESSETGLLVAFHRLQQSLTGLTRLETVDSYDMDRLQLMVTQGLGGLLGAAGLNWDLLLDMQVSRGSDPFELADADELRRRVVGGVAVRF
ncbi:MAG: carboxypeptidase regulatory-like domain-containing protein [Acidobacteria bacterium]|nr:MAG: carboxypeptidase regulatory-like domain-containing protein [Acidobacteriota bacterium]